MKEADEHIYQCQKSGTSKEAGNLKQARGTPGQGPVWMGEQGPKLEDAGW